MSPRSGPKTEQTLSPGSQTAQNLTQLSHLSELQLEAITRLGGHGSQSEGMRAPSQEGQHFHLPSGRLGSAPPLHPR